MAISKTNWMGKKTPTGLTGLVPEWAETYLQNSQNWAIQQAQNARLESLVPTKEWLPRIHQTIAWSQSTKIHDNWLPFTIGATLHALTIAVFYTRTMQAQSKSHKKGMSQPGWLQAMLAMSTLALTGPTVNALLMGIPPIWLTSPALLLTDITVFTLVYSTSVGSLVLALPRLPLDTFLCFADGVARVTGITIMGIDGALLSADPKHAAIRSSWTGLVLLGVLGGGMGGAVAQLFGMLQTHWHFQTPAQVQGSIFQLGWDIRGAFFVSLLYNFLIQSHPFFSIPLHIAHALVPRLPYVHNGTKLSWVKMEWYKSIDALVQKGHGLSSIKLKGISSEAAQSWNILGAKLTRIQPATSKSAGQAADDIAHGQIIGPLLDRNDARAFCAVVMISILIARRFGLLREGQASARADRVADEIEGSSGKHGPVHSIEDAKAVAGDKLAETEKKVDQDAALVPGVLYPPKAEVVSSSGENVKKAHT